MSQDMTALRKLVKGFSKESGILERDPINRLLDEDDDIDRVFDILNRELRKSTYPEVLYAGLNFLYYAYQLLCEDPSNERYRAIWKRTSRISWFAMEEPEVLEKDLKESRFFTALKINGQSYEFVQKMISAMKSFDPESEFDEDEIASGEKEIKRSIAILTNVNIYIILCGRRLLKSGHRVKCEDNLVKASYKVCYRNPWDTTERRPVCRAAEYHFDYREIEGTGIVGYVAKYLDLTGIEERARQFHEYMTSDSCFTILQNRTVITMDPADFHGLIKMTQDTAKEVVDTKPEPVVREMDDGQALVTMLNTVHHTLPRTHLDRARVSSMQNRMINDCDDCLILAVFYNDAKVESKFND